MYCSRHVVGTKTKLYSFEGGIVSRSGIPSSSESSSASKSSNEGLSMSPPGPPPRPPICLMI